MQSHPGQTLGTHTRTHTHRKPCLIPVKVSGGCYMFAVHFSPIKMRHWKFTGLSVAQWGHINTLVHQYVRTLTHTLQMLTLSDPCYHLEPGVWFSHLRCQDQAPVGSPCLPPRVCVVCGLHIPDSGVISLIRHFPAHKPPLTHVYLWSLISCYFTMLPWLTLSLSFSFSHSLSLSLYPNRCRWVSGQQRWMPASVRQHHGELRVSVHRGFLPQWQPAYLHPSLWW